MQGAIDFLKSDPVYMAGLVTMYLVAWTTGLTAASNAAKARGYVRLAFVLHVLALRPAPMSKAAIVADVTDAAITAMRGEPPQPGTGG